MRIALVSQEYPPGRSGGICTQTHCKALSLAALGHEVHVIAHSSDAGRHVLREGNVHVTRIPDIDSQIAIHSEPFRWLSYSMQVAIAVTEIHEENPFDIIEFPEYGAEGYAYLLNRPQPHRAAVVVQLHGPLVMLAQTIGWPEVDSEFYRVGTHMEAACVRLADAVYSSSGCSAEWCQRHYGLDASRVPVIHTGIDTGLFRRKNIRRSVRPTIVFVGKIVTNKGVEVLVEAACRLLPKLPDLRVKLIGRGEQPVLRRLRELVARAGAPDMLDEVGFVEHEQLPEHLSGAHVFAAPSRYEGGPGFVYLEAMACELPVIACAGSGAAEVVSPEVTGTLVPPDDVDALSAALERLLTSERLRETMGHEGRAFVTERASKINCIGHIESFYRGVIESRMRGAG
jgi:glycosyltransferase involved in cell wall biosynthesis